MTKKNKEDKPRRFCYFKREEAKLSLLFSNCDNKKTCALYLVFNQRLMQRKEHLFVKRKAKLPSCPQTAQLKSIANEDF